MVIPEQPDREAVSEIIYKELCCGIFSKTAKETYLKVIKNLELQGVQGVLLACTEIPLLIKNGEANIPLYETTYLHAIAAVDEALNESLTTKQSFL